MKHGRIGLELLTVLMISAGIMQEMMVSMAMIVLTWPFLFVIKY